MIPRFETLDELIQENRYSRHPFVSAVESGAVMRTGLNRWAVQKYLQVYHQNNGFSAVHANSEYEDVRQFEIEQLIAEETSLDEGSDTHYNLMKRFAVATGVPEEDVRSGAPMGQPVRDHLDHLIGTCKTEHFVYGLLAFYVIESQTPESARRLFNALRDSYGFTPHELEWFEVHAGADIEHSGTARHLIEKYSSEAPEFSTRSLALVERGVEVWNRLQDYYYSLLGASASEQVA